MKNNLIFLNENELDKKIYRIFSYSRLIEIFNENKLTLVKPKLWDDPFENFILNSTGTLPDGRNFQIDFRDNFYGQCWSQNKESDAMWRIYSPDKDGVKVSTTIRKLFNSLYSHKVNQILYRHNNKLNSVFIGKVNYANEKDLLSMLQDEKRMSGKVYDETGWGQASSFYFKRVAFKHESEVRIIYKSQNHNSSDIFDYPINPVELFDEIVFDPRFQENRFNEMKIELMSLGYNKPITQSSLYKIRSFTISLRQR